MQHTTIFCCISVLNAIVQSCKRNHCLFMALYWMHWRSFWWMHDRIVSYCTTMDSRYALELKTNPLTWCKLFACWVIFHAFLSYADFFQNHFFKKFFQEYHQSVKQFGSRSGLTFWMSGLIWVQTVFKSYEQTKQDCFVLQLHRH